MCVLERQGYVYLEVGESRDDRVEKQSIEDDLRRYKRICQGYKMSM